MELLTTPKDLNSMVANMLHNKLNKPIKDPFKSIRFVRIMRGLSEEEMSNRLGLPFDEYKIFENEPQNFSKQKILTKLLDNTAKILGCSYEFISGYSQYVYDNRSNDLTQDKYERICITKEFVRNRMQEIINIDNLNKDKIFKDFNTIKLSMINNGTKNLVFIKEISKRLNCTWQYIAGLSFNRWSDDVVMSCFNDKIRGYVITNHIENISKHPEYQDKLKTLMSERLRLLRDSRDIKQDDMATILNVSRQYYSKYETGEIKFWKNYDAVLTIASVLECTPEYLLLMSDKENGLGYYNQNFIELETMIYEIQPFYFNKEYINPLNMTLSEIFREIVKIKDKTPKTKIINILKELISEKSEKEQLIKIVEILLEDEKN